MMKTTIKTTATLMKTESNGSSDARRKPLHGRNSGWVSASKLRIRRSMRRLSAARATRGRAHCPSIPHRRPQTRVRGRLPGSSGVEGSAILDAPKISSRLWCAGKDFYGFFIFKISLVFSPKLTGTLWEREEKNTRTPLNGAQSLVPVMRDLLRDRPGSAPPFPGAAHAGDFGNALLVAGRRRARG